MPTAPIDIRVDMAKWNRVLAGVARAKDKAIEEVFPGRARGLVRKAADVFPPSGKNRTGVQAKHAGEARVTADMLSWYATAARAKKLFKDPKVAGSFARAMRQGNFPRARAILSRAGHPWATVTPAAFDGGRAIDSVRRAKGTRSLTRTKAPAYIIPSADGKALSALIREKRSHVGRMAAGLKRVAAAVGVRLAAWIERHSGGAGYGDARLKGSRLYVRARVPVYSHRMLADINALWRWALREHMGGMLKEIRIVMRKRLRARR